MIRLWNVGSLTLLSCMLVGTTWAADVNEFIDFSLGGPTDRRPVLGRLYVPPEAADSERPFVLFLHGAGESGRDNVSQVNGNIDNLFDEVKSRGAFLYAPQTVLGNWSDSTLTNNVMAMIDQAMIDYNVDPNRVYVTGLSLGGGGTWNMLNRFGDRFAAGLPIAPIAPSGDFDPTNFLDQSVWVVHARDDNIVPADASRQTTNRILTAAGQSALRYPNLSNRSTLFDYEDPVLDYRYTELPEGGHGIWFGVYRTPAVHDWLFSRSLVIPEPTTLAMCLTLAAICAATTRKSRPGVMRSEQ